MKKRWSSANITLEPFFKKNKDWVNKDLIFPKEYSHEVPSSSTAGIPPKRPKSFKQLSKRQKRRRTEDFRKCSEAMLNFVIKKNKSEKVCYVTELIKSNLL